MAETQRQPVPRNDSGELDTALAFLTFARESVLKKTHGLDDEQLRRVLVDTGTTLLGLVHHLTAAERYWFGYHVAGDRSEKDRDFGMDVTELDAAQVLADYHTAIQVSDAAIRAAGDPAAPVAEPVDGEFRTLRWVLAHMTSETARHAGHADILREQIDGTTGR
ncbi:DinB family protein [Nonomuraea sp. NPDC004354]